MSNSEKHWWQELPLIISAVQVKMTDDDDWTLDEYVSKSGFTVEQNLHLVAKDTGTGYSDMGYYYEDEDGENLDRYLKKSRRYGIREIIYTNTHCVPVSFGEAHPEWLQLDDNGNKIMAYNVYNMVCVNPKNAYHKHLLKEFEGLCHHDIDGIFLDGPIMRNNGCRCPVCQQEFLETYGHTMEEGTHAERMEMSVRSAVGHVREIHDLVKSINPEIALYINNSALRPDITGSNTRRVYDYVDMLGAEGGFYKPSLNKNSQFQTSVYAKYLEGISKDPLKAEKPVINFFAGNESALTYYMHTPAETLLTYAESYANGANVWYGVHYQASEFMHTESSQMSVRMNHFILDNRKYFGASKTCARIALVWSEANANHYSSSVAFSDFTAAIHAADGSRGDQRDALLVLAEALIRRHIQFDILDDIAVESGKLSGYECALLPSIGAMSDRFAEEIKCFVKNGGNLLTAYEVGICDENGNPREIPALAELLGLKGRPQILKRDIGKGYMHRLAKQPPVDTLSLDRIPSPQRIARFGYEDDVSVLLDCTATMPSTYAVIPEERFPAVTVKKYGKGKAVYVAGDFLESTMQRNVLDFTEIFGRFCEAYARPVVISEHEGLYEVVLRRLEDCFALHIINITSPVERPVKKTVPLYDIPFSLDLSGFGLNIDNAKLKTLRGGSLNGIRTEENKVTFRLDALKDYEVVILE